MSKAFTKEHDDAPVAAPTKRGAPVPEPNFVTPKGAAAARAELDELVRSAGDSDRIRELGDHLATAQSLEPTDRCIVGLGATVTVEDASGKRTIYRIVGAIEADAKLGRVSWQSPIANALWDARVGDSIDLPRGEVEIIAIEYD